MSAQEFGEWKVVIKHEQLHPAALRYRHAQLQAVMLQGPSTRKNGKGWFAADLMPPDPWAEPPVGDAGKVGRRVSVPDQVKALNARRRVR
jgi:hypothetical protein